MLTPTRTEGRRGARRGRSAMRVAAVGAVAGLLAACGSGSATPTVSSTGSSPVTSRVSSAVSTPTSPVSSPAASPSRPSPSVRADLAHRLFATMPVAARAGQLIMVGTPADQSASEQVRADLTDDRVGSVILTGRSSLSVAQTRQITDELRQDAPTSTGLLVATDQEGGEVQVLQGSGFGSMPSGLEQGRLAPATLRADAAGWGRALHSAGVDLDLAPVLDTVPSSSFAASNPPIGGFDREYGFDPATVSSHGVAFLRGLADAGVDSSPKHFPGLGRVTANTDVSSGVTDSVTTPTDAYLQPYRDAIAAGTRFVMVSTAVYTRIDPDHPAAFSPTVVTDLLRGALGFRGVVVSDDVGAAAQVSDVSPGQRAVDFVAAGGDLVLTVDATQTHEMTQALIARAGSDPAFAALLDAAALRVLEAKQARGLLH